MAQYYTDFSEYADTTALLAEWTPRWQPGSYSLVSDAGATGGKFHRNSGSQQRKAISWDRLDSDAGRDTVEMLFRVRTSSTAAGNIGALARGSGSASNETGYVFQITGDGSRFRTALYTSGAFSVLSNFGSSSTGTWYWMRALVSGDELRAKAWLGAVTDEPAEWLSSLTNTEITAAGWVGLFAFSPGDNDCDIFSVGTNGDPAPTGPVAAGGAPTLTLPSASLITASSIVPNVTLTF